MKKVIALLVVCLVLFAVVAPTPAVAADAGAATVLSLVMPGTGEWYNGGFQGSFPWGECIVGYICFCFQLSSAVDAANGSTDSNMRLDFWSAP